MYSFHQFKSSDVQHGCSLLRTAGIQKAFKQQMRAKRQLLELQGQRPDYPDRQLAPHIPLGARFFLPGNMFHATVKNRLSGGRPAQGFPCNQSSGNPQRVDRS